MTADTSHGPPLPSATASQPAASLESGTLPSLKAASAIGPPLVGVIIGVQATIGAWRAVPAAPPTPAQSQELTALGLAWFRPDHDMPVYLAGVALALVLAAALGTAWRRRIARVRDTDHAQWLQLLLLLHLPVGAALAVLQTPRLTWAAVALGAAFSVSALLAAKRPPRIALRWLSHALSSSGARDAVAAERAARLAPRWRTLPRSVRLVAGSVVGLVAVAAIVYVPLPELIVARAYALDHFHHIDFYAMAPALAFRHGAALGTDFYSQYGVGWPMVLSLLAHIFPPLDYALLVTMCVVFGCVYFFALHCFLRLLTGSWRWATAGVLCALLLQLFGGTDGPPKWLWPSSTVARYAMDVFMFSACLLHARTRRPWLGLMAGACAGLALLLGVDTGLYLVICLAGYAVAVSRIESPAGLSMRRGPFVASALFGFGAVFIGGMAFASRGTLLSWDFWSGWVEALRIYGSGFAHLPVAEALGGRKSWAASVLLVLILGCYLFAVSRLLQTFVDRSISPEQLIVGLVACNGLATLLLFVGRSAPYNMTHVSVPFCIVLTSYAAEASRTLQRGIPLHWPARVRQPFTVALRWLPVACIAFIGWFMHLSAAFREYPNVFWHMAHRWSPNAVADADVRLAHHRFKPASEGVRSDVANFRIVSAAVKALSANGTRSVAFIDGDDTAHLVEADLAPRFRYSPVLANVAYKWQVALIERQLAAAPPDYVVMPLVAPEATIGVRMTDTFDSMLQAVLSTHVADRQVADKMVYRRKGLAFAPPGQTAGPSR